MLRLAFLCISVSFYFTFQILCYQDSLIAAESNIATKVGTHGGLVLQIGAQDISQVSAMAKTGRYLVRILEKDPKSIQKVRKSLHDQGLYGMVSVDQLAADGKLPFAENIVNLILIEQTADDIPAAEFARVLTPNGTMIIAESISKDFLKQVGLDKFRKVKVEKTWLVGQKPFPGDMDIWSHPRHASDGNAVSNDTQVGPPRRVRWVVGAQAEVRGMVTAGGKNFYAGVLTRDSFNGLRLWDRNLLKPSEEGKHVMKNLSRSVPNPVSSGDYLFAVSEKKLLSLDASTGETVHEFVTSTAARHLLYDAGILVAICDSSVEAFDVETAKKLWEYQSAAPRFAVMGKNMVAFLQGNVKRGEKVTAVVLEGDSGKVRWQNSSYPWLSQVTRSVFHGGKIAYEVSTFNDNGLDNAIHILSATDGKSLLDHVYLPGMNHRRQARAMFINEKLWVLHGGKDKDKKRLPIQVSSIDVLSGKTLSTHDAGLAHCFPPVATTNYLFSGELDLTDLRTGEVDANRITKANCSADSGWIPANGLIYLTPKHCTCWPMLRGYTALAPERKAGDIGKLDVKNMEFKLESGEDPPTLVSKKNDDWPAYRNDNWRSASTSAAGPTELKTLWTTNLGKATDLTGPIVDDWNENPFIKGPISSPVISEGMAYVAHSDTHTVIGMDANSGDVRWRFTANGRVDTAPTIYNGLCLFGSKSGWVFCLNAKTGKLVWKRQAAPVDEQIVAYGQLESPWPVAGSVLIMNDTAYFAAGRQSLADGGILIFAVDPAFGYLRWVERLNTVPQKGFYRNSGLEFDNYDLLNREGDGVAMSRWVFNGKSGKMSIEPWSAFSKLKNGDKSAMVPRGSWSYPPRHQRRIKSYTAKRSLVSFRENILIGSLQGRNTIYRRDFDLEGGEKFDEKWMTGWAASSASRKGAMPWRSTRLAEKAKWKTNVFDPEQKQTIDALVYAGDKIYLAGSQGDLQIRSATDGKLIKSAKLPPVMWDGIAIANQKLYYATQDGHLVCIGL